MVRYYITISLIWLAMKTCREGDCYDALEMAQRMEFNGHFH